MPPGIFKLFTRGGGLVNRAQSDLATTYPPYSPVMLDKRTPFKAWSVCSTTLDLLFVHAKSSDVITFAWRLLIAKGSARHRFAPQSFIVRLSSQHRPYTIGWSCLVETIRKQTQESQNGSR